MKHGNRRTILLMGLVVLGLIGGFGREILPNRLLRTNLSLPCMSPFLRLV